MKLTLWCIILYIQSKNCYQTWTNYCDPISTISITHISKDKFQPITIQKKQKQIKFPKNRYLNLNLSPMYPQIIVETI